MTPTPAAVMNAVSRAARAPLTQFPITAERVLTALKNSPFSAPLTRSASLNPSPPSGERAAFRAETLPPSRRREERRGEC